jgi:divalent metal cation (Fe/Co/Zn/Cd) transporter
MISTLGSKIIWWLDPIGAIGVGLLILKSWSMSAWENVLLIVGRSAPPAVLNKITYLAATHHPAVLQVDTCKAYSLGNHLFVEVDIVLPPEMTLRESHDIGESLQIKLESLPNVERAFVHCDYEFDHRPEHVTK